MRLNILVFGLSLLIFFTTKLEAANFVDISQDVSGCVLNSTYWFMPLGTWESNKISCLAEDFGTSRLVVVDDQFENDCLAKYVMEHYTPSTSVKYSIGLTDKQYKGIWEWENSDYSTAHFQHWAPGSPTTSKEDCAFMFAGETESKTGFWGTVACSSTTAGLYAICEKPNDEGLQWF
ncbi:hypothetical protein TCAL_13852 [Tigriopus californicus]|uniref:C-type lectin domain-containing protein n=1 Tax=Tigriopus californicus TaxID=6832 RepID=A0A553NSC8_TIGCA|nr:hepatic lectin-like [Tigriopus californicus]TRY68343.1 hypothetical protein TCAL_13852 [Tigriopus californicus]